MSLPLSPNHPLPSFLAYYLRYKLLLCAKCYKIISTTSTNTLQRHLFTHLTSEDHPYTKEDKHNILTHLRSLNVLPFLESYHLVLQASANATLAPFKELPLL